MSDRPALFRLVPSPLRRRLKDVFRPYATRLMQAYLDDHMESFLDEYIKAKFPGMIHRNLQASATHIPSVPRRDHPSGLWGYVSPSADPEGERWSDGLPIPPQHLWHGYTDNTDKMMEIGVNNHRRVHNLLEETGAAPAPGDRVLDFGCAGGFVLRNFREIADDKASGGQVWGVDFSGPHIDWCLRHLSPPFRFALTSSIPSLPFPDEYFDFAYCISVFSHMGENCDGWLLELARVLRPGGRLYLSLVTKQSMKDYFEHRPKLGFSTAMKRRFRQAQLESDFATAVVQNGPGCHSVFDLDFFKTKCEGMFDVQLVRPNVHSFQWVLVLERKHTRRRLEPVVRATNVADVTGNA